ncbi:hypothetical protein KDA_07170 [Dictyobacter alpinus]|uniref:Zinc-ribbon domain-containing protein n=1 Tax=Dictyobacter alpinus TaxID=2014873 RepID=A0A402B1M1_9CHLR|nr:zinc ribbon domain-containing protein [Dictyobacter alpinus]GCE25233.1 hypothetical protein KDA_07170 [Dictyobacter alpinus]
MAQALPPYCPRCGTETSPRQRFCAKCGLPIVPPTRVQQRFSSQPPSSPGFQEQYSAQPFASRSAQNADNFMPSPSPVSARSQRRRIGPAGVILLVIVVLLLLGTAGYFVLPLLGIGKATQATITTSDLQTTVNYAGMDVTLLNAQQADNFIDDPQTHTDGMLRLHIQAMNKNKKAGTLFYSTIAHLALPGGKELAPIYASDYSAIAPGETKSSSVDFAVPSATKVNQLTLLLGDPAEARLNIPLQAHADMGKYAPKTSTINKKASYLSLDYLVTQTTTSWSLDGQQAPKGMHYLSVTMKVGNPLTQTVIAGSPFDYMRMKAGNATVAPEQATVPLKFAPQAADQDGEAVFLIPQDATTATLLLGSNTGDGFDPGTIEITL